MAGSLQLGSLTTAKAFGPAQFYLRDATKNRVVVGTIIGRVRSITFNNMADRETGEIKKVYQLVGLFEATPYDVTMQPCRSGKAGLPDVVMAPIVELFENDKVGVAIDIALEMGVERSKSPLGYSWFCRNLLPDDVTTDPLASIRALVKTESTLLLPSGSHLVPVAPVVPVEPVMHVASDTGVVSHGFKPKK